MAAEMAADSAAEMPAATGSRLRVTDRAGACRLVADTSAIITDLVAVLEDENAHLRAGRLRQGLANEARKTELAGLYFQAVQACRANAIALARFARDEIAALKSAHAGFQAAVERNQMVLATARTVSESLVKSLAGEMAQAGRPQVYGAARQMVAGGSPAMPLVCSRSF